MCSSSAHFGRRRRLLGGLLLGDHRSQLGAHRRLLGLELTLCTLGLIEQGCGVRLQRLVGDLLLSQRGSIGDEGPLLVAQLVDGDVGVTERDFLVLIRQQRVPFALEELRRFGRGVSEIDVDRNGFFLQMLSIEHDSLLVDRDSLLGLRDLAGVLVDLVRAGDVLLLVAADL